MKTPSDNKGDHITTEPSSLMKDKEGNEKGTGDGIVAENARWTFSGPMVKAFSAHVRKSVPFYDEGHALVAKLSDYFIKDDSVCYELGCSTGVLTAKLAERHKEKQARFIGIDIEGDMISQARQEAYDLRHRVEFIHSSISEMKMEASDLIISYYTMQFISPQKRQDEINRIYDSLNWGGAFIMFEKVRAPDARFQDYMSGLYVDYKLEQGYSSEEILSKTRSLKRVLEPFSTEGNYGLMKRSGFVDIMTIMKYVCFEGYLAIK